MASDDIESNVGNDPAPENTARENPAREITASSGTSGLETPTMPALTEEQERLRARREFLAAGIGIPVIAGLLIYLTMDAHNRLPTIGFLVGVPAFLSLLPLLLTDLDAIRTYRRYIFLPLITTIVLFAILFATRLEALICLVVLAAPFLLGGLIVFWLGRFLIRRYGRRRGLQVSFMIPVMIVACELAVETPTETRRVERSVVVRSTPSEIFANVTRVRPIAPDEVERGFWQLVGIPAPIEATLDRDGVGATRIGRFERGLRFVERVIAWEPDRYVEFTVTVDTASLDDPMLDRHVLAHDYFAFGTVSYRITPIDDEQVRVTLACSYHLRSTVNRYSALWGDAVIGDFEERLLEVIRRRCDRSEDAS